MTTSDGNMTRGFHAAHERPEMYKKTMQVGAKAQVATLGL
jgi:hypothetical protein